MVNLMEMTKGLNGMLNGKSAAAYLGIHLRRLQRLFHTKNKKQRIPHYKIEKRYYCRPEDLDAWLENQKNV